MIPPNISSLFSVPSGTAYNPQSVPDLADGVVSALESVLLTPGTGVDQMSLQAVIQGRPDAEYQRIIDALIKLHQHQHQQFALMKPQMQQPPLPGIDYRALIVEVRKVQARQIGATQQHHTLQSLQGRQQQPQTAAQQYQALIEQQYQQKAAVQQQQQTAQCQALRQQQQGNAVRNAAST